MPQLKLANCPVSWGIEEADQEQPGWERLLTDAADAGYAGIELGPVGYFPTEGDTFAQALRRHGLELIAGYVMEPLSDPARRERTLEVAAATCEMLARHGASTLVLIDDMSPERSATAGREDAAVRATDAQWEQLLSTAGEVARLAVEQHGLTVAFHPHAGTLVEFSDEIERFFAEADASVIDVCVDTGHSLYADVDPLALIERYADRLRYLHLKDVDGAVLAQARNEKLDFEQAVRRGIFCPYGRGGVDLNGLRTALTRAGYEGTGAVEQDRAPGAAGPVAPVEDARTSLVALVDAGLTIDRRGSERDVFA